MFDFFRLHNRLELVVNSSVNHDPCLKLEQQQPHRPPH
jgi:hypothetical protein